MAIELRQQLKLAQKLILTPQLQQAIKLLQLSRLDLLDTISQELESNPLLEESLDSAPEHNDPMQDGECANHENTSEVTVDERLKEDLDWEAYLGDYISTSRTRTEREVSPQLPTVENRLTKKSSLTAHLLWQLHLSRLSDPQKEIGNFIIGSLDKDGYLRTTISEIAEMAHCDEATVEEVLFLIQQFDPLGVAARDLQECLLIQAKSLELEDDLVVTIIKNHLKDLENKNYRTIGKATRRAPEEIQAAIELITRLDPKPGQAFNEEEVQYISPDIYVYNVDNDFVIVLNEDGLSKLRVSTFYLEALGKEGDVDRADREYIQNKLQSAAWLIKSIHQRQRTIYRVAESIVRFQRDFFEKGIAYLRPLVLRDVAQDIGMHESTISRATTNKYMHTPRGIFELKYFFTSSIGSLAGSEVSAESVKERIRKIIKEENPQKPYSDQAVVEKLREENVDIARRTVAKYREVLGILPASRRKQPKWGN
jgi:RNA polymerase sigma-54 factor